MLKMLHGHVVELSLISFQFHPSQGFPPRPTFLIEQDSVSAVSATVLLARSNEIVVSGIRIERINPTFSNTLYN